MSAQIIDIQIQAKMYEDTMGLTKIHLVGEPKACVETFLAVAREYPEFKDLIKQTYLNLDRDTLKWFTEEQP